MNCVLESAYSVCASAKDVKINQDGIKTAAQSILSTLQASPYTTAKWSTVPLHPIPGLHPPAEILNWIFLVSTLNFSFWSDRPTDSRYGVRWNLAADRKDQSGNGETKVWTGYWSLLAALHRAREEGVAITDPREWSDADEKEIRRWLRSDQEEEIPLLDERVRVIREAGTVLCESFKGSFSNLLEQANGSSLALVELIVKLFSSYDDRTTYNGRPVFIRKRAQILVAETWAAFEGQGPGAFHDIDKLTMFADYRVPQILHSLSTLTYSPALISHLTSFAPLANGSALEVEIRCGSIVAVEEIRREIARLVDEGKVEGVEVPNAVLLDFLLWDAAKVEEAKGREALPHHRTRSVFY